MVMVSSNVSLEVRRRLALDVQAKPEFVALVQRVAEYQVQVGDFNVASDDEEKLAVDSMVAMRTTEKEIETLRKQAVAFPNMYVRAVNDTFRNMKDSLGKAINTLGAKVLAYREEKRRQAEAEYQERLEAQQEADRLVGGGGSGTVETLKIGAEVLTPPSNVTEGTQGKIYERVTLKVEVVDKLAICKAVLSKAKANEKITLKVIDINQKELEQLVLREKVKVPGVEVREVKTLVTSQK
jgi:hypothetical protein